MKMTSTFPPTMVAMLLPWFLPVPMFYNFKFAYLSSVQTLWRLGTSLCRYVLP
ncbi:hypothetical protein L218DRAFT_964517 [Marasmius fiardii PR-910]|nr:hypothetical protein L218DRAFT_964517 [Marasmius fiardii PR-910]